MLDTHARGLVQPVFDRMARGLAGVGIAPLQVTIGAVLLGSLAAGALVLGWTGTFLALLWASGLLDALDGTLARIGGVASRGGAMLDVVCDRLVEVLVILAFGLGVPEARLALLALSCAVVLSLTVFLTAAAALPVSADKSFHYQAGLAERTEGFLFFSLMALYPEGVGPVALVFALAVAFTAAQRLRAALRLFRD